MARKKAANKIGDPADPKHCIPEYLQHCLAECEAHAARVDRVASKDDESRRHIASIRNFCDIVRTSVVSGDAALAAMNGFCLGECRAASSMADPWFKETYRRYCHTKLNQRRKTGAEERKEQAIMALQWVPDGVRRDGAAAVYNHIAKQLGGKPDTIRKYLKGVNLGIG